MQLLFYGNTLIGFNVSLNLIGVLETNSTQCCVISAIYRILLRIEYMRILDSVQVICARRL